jgi:hypothetical protein
MTFYLVVNVFIQHHTVSHTHALRRHFQFSTVTGCLKGNMRSYGVTGHSKSWGECMRGWRQWLKRAGTQFRAPENLHLQFPSGQGPQPRVTVERGPRII